MALEEHGDLRGALDQIHLALASQEKLLADHPRDRKYRRALSRTYDAMGRALDMGGDIAGALEEIRRDSRSKRHRLQKIPRTASISGGWRSAMQTMATIATD
jgi:hypothetical protein